MLLQNQLDGLEGFVLLRAIADMATGPLPPPQIVPSPPPKTVWRRARRTAKPQQAKKPQRRRDGARVITVHYAPTGTSTGPKTKLSAWEKYAIMLAETLKLRER